jgi:hypothetical protein
MFLSVFQAKFFHLFARPQLFFSAIFVQTSAIPQMEVLSLLVRGDNFAISENAIIYKNYMLSHYFSFGNFSID